MDEDRVADLRVQQRPLDAAVALLVRDLASPSPSCTAGRRPSGRSSSPGRRSSPMIASRSFGTTCQVTGTAATQYSRPARRRPSPGSACSAIATDRDGGHARAASTNARGPRRQLPVITDATSPRHAVTSTSPSMSGPWIQQKNLYLPGLRERDLRRVRQRHRAGGRSSPAWRRSRCRGSCRRRCSRPSAPSRRAGTARPGSAPSGPAAAGRSSSAGRWMYFFGPNDDVVRLLRRLVHERHRRARLDRELVREVAERSSPSLPRPM